LKSAPGQAGRIYAAIFAAELYRMYHRLCIRRLWGGGGVGKEGLKTEDLDPVPSDLVASRKRSSGFRANPLSKSFVPSVVVHRVNACLPPRPQGAFIHPHDRGCLAGAEDIDFEFQPKISDRVSRAAVRREGVNTTDSAVR